MLLDATPGGLAVDVFATARNAGMPIVVLDDYDKVMNRYGIYSLTDGTHPFLDPASRPPWVSQSS